MAKMRIAYDIFYIGKCWASTYVCNACVPWFCDSNVSVCRVFVNCLRAYIYYKVQNQFV